MSKKSTFGKPLVLGAVVFGSVALGAVLTYAWMGGGFHHGMIGRGMMGGGMHGHQRGAMQHDEVNMPGLQGENATAEESEELAVMFRNFRTMTRTVENLPNGIRTVTKSSDPKVMEVLITHATGMINRVENKDDPKIRIQSPTLDIFFRKGDQIETDIDVTDEGLVITQTSKDPKLVKALQTHAAEVTDMAERGMQAVHEKMMASGRGH